MKAFKIFGILIVASLILACGLPSISFNSPTATAEPVPTETDLPQGGEDLADFPPSSLQISKIDYAPGAEILVSFTAPAGYAANAWIGIVPADTPHGSEAENDQYDLVYEYIDGRTEGTVIFLAPEEAGDYEIRMFDSDDDGQESAAIGFTVTGESASAVEDAQSTASVPAYPGQEYTCRNITLNLPDELADGITCEVVPASDAGEDLPFWEIYPEYDHLLLDGYVLQNTFHQAQIFVYPIADYIALDPNVDQVIAELQQLLADESEGPESIPFLPSFNAAQMLRMKIDYFDFSSGSGVRFLTMYGQAAYPLNNQMMFYTYQGITADNQYYVSVVLPISNPALPATDQDANIADWNAFYENFGIYVADTTLEVNMYADDSFAPTITLLDQFVASITVE
jgi:hypothetical protein